MSNTSGDEITPPLPRGWLPDAQPPEGEPHWDRTAARIAAAVRPELQHLATGLIAAEAPLMSRLGLWWRSAAALAVASAAALVVVLDRVEPAWDLQTESIPLELMAANGDPVALWTARGIPAHPVLALIAVQEGEVAGGQAAGTNEGEEESR